MTADNDYILGRFKEKIADCEDLLFGTVLFSEGCSIIHAGNEALLAATRGGYTSTLQRGRDVVARARLLLLEAEIDPSKIAQVTSFKFPPWTDEMRQRALVLIETYNELFPGRPRHEPLTLEEHQTLMRAAMDRI